MKILIDLQGVQGGSRFRGIGKYSIELVKSVARANRSHDIKILLTSGERESVNYIKEKLLGIIPESSIYVTYVKAPLDYISQNTGLNINTSALARCAHIRQIDPDVVLVTSHFEGYGDNVTTNTLSLTSDYPHVAIMYDLIPAMNPESYLEPSKLFADFYIDKLNELYKYTHLLAISESAKREAVEFAGIAAERVTNIGAAANSIFRPLDISPEAKLNFLRPFRIVKKYVLVAGATDPRKNHLRLIEAFSLLPLAIRKQYQLVIAGKLQPGDLERFLRHAADYSLTENDVIATNSISDDEMVVLCNLADVAISPSLHEGFGLPALEAMMCGAVVIGSNTSSLPEVIGDSTALFDPYSPESMSQLLEKAIVDEEFRKHRRAHAIDQSRLFSWDKIGSIVLNTLEKVASTKNSVTRLNEQFDPQFLIRKVRDGYYNDIKELGDDTIAQLKVFSQLCAVNINFDGRSKRLLVDISELVNRDSRTGIQRVVRSIVLELLAEPPAGYQVTLVYGTCQSGYFEANEFVTKITGSASSFEDRPVDFSCGDVFIGLDLQHVIVTHNVDFYQTLRAIGCKVYFVVYDLLPVQFPHFFQEGMSSIHHDWLSVLSQMDGVVCISRAVADDMYKWLAMNGPLRVTPLQIGYFHLGADISNSAPTKGLPANHASLIENITKHPSFLMVGTVEPRKGHLQTIDAFEYLWNQGVQFTLVIVGKEGWKVGELAERLRSHSLNGSQLFWFDKASDEFLELLYANSDCLICASEGEGFGLPIIEAAQKNIPVLTRDLPVFREVAGPQASYFSGLAPEDLAGAVQQWVNGRSSSKPLAPLEKNWLTWNESKNQLLQNVIDNRWYKYWESDRILRYPAASPVMHTQCGVRSGSSILSNGTEGFLLYGPYQPLEKGKYSVRLRYDATYLSGNEWLDITCDAGVNKLHHHEMVSSLVDDSSLSFLIENDHYVSDLEIRVFVDATTQISIYLIEITPISDSFSIESLLGVQETELPLDVAMTVVEANKYEDKKTVVTRSVAAPRGNNRRKKRVN